LDGHTAGQTACIWFCIILMLILLPLTITFLILYGIYKCCTKGKNHNQDGLENNDLVEIKVTEQLQQDDNSM